MLDNYVKTVDGSLKQINTPPYIYDSNYIETRYVNLPTNDIMSYLRLGFIVGSIGHIPNSILDVGYGSGAFLNACVGFIPEVYGNDIPPAFDLPPGVSFVTDICEKEVEVITFFDSLEHFTDIEFVKNLKCKYVIISLPWCYDCDNDEWFMGWKHRRHNEHIYHFNEESLNNFMNRNGFVLKQYSNVEDSIRIDKNLKPNILTACFEKK